MSTDKIQSIVPPPVYSNSGAPPTYLASAGQLNLNNSFKGPGYAQTQGPVQAQGFHQVQGSHQVESQIPDQIPKIDFIKPQALQYESNYFPAAEIDFSKSSGPVFASCPYCRLLAMSKIEKKVSCFQLTTGMFLLFFAVVPGILVIVLCHDVEHRCIRCNHLLGIKKDPQDDTSQIPVLEPVDYSIPIEELPPLIDTNFEIPEGEIPIPSLTDDPTFFVCPNCNFCGPTKVDKVRGTCAMLCCCSFFIGDTFYDYQHTCPQCRIIIGTYESL